MGDVGMAQGVHRNAQSLDACPALGLTEGALYTGLGHGGVGHCSALAAAAESGQDERRAAVRCSVFAMPEQARLRQRHKAVSCPFAEVHVNHHALAVDVRDLHLRGLLETQGAGVDGSEEGAVFGRCAQRRARRAPPRRRAPRAGAARLGTRARVRQLRLITWTETWWMPQ